MTNKEILKGLRYRLKNLESAHKSFLEEADRDIEKHNSFVICAFRIEERIDEVEAVINWIKENKDEK